MLEPTTRITLEGTDPRASEKRSNRLNYSPSSYAVSEAKSAKYHRLIAAADTINDLKKSEPPPRHYQLAAVSALLESALQYNQGGFVELPMGTGKTTVALNFLQCYQAPLSIISAPSDVILKQFHQQIETLLPASTVIYASSESDVTTINQADMDHPPRIILMSHAALRTHARALQNSLRIWNEQHEQAVPIIVDEGHQAIGIATGKTIRSLPGLRIGFTATSNYRYVRPAALGEETPDVRHRDPKLLSMEDVFGKRLYSFSLIESVRSEFTPPFAVYGQTFGYEKASQAPGYDLTQLNQELLTSAAVNLISKELKDKKVIVVCQNKKQAEQLLELLNPEHQQQSSERREVAILTGNQSSDKRREVLETIEPTTNGVLIGIQIVKTGIDLPNVDSVVVLGATISAVHIAQAFGRALRLRLDHQKRTQPAKQLYFLRAAHAPGSMNQLVETALNIPVVDSTPLVSHHEMITSQAGNFLQEKIPRLILDVSLEYARSLASTEESGQAVFQEQSEFQIASVLTGSNPASLWQRQRKLALIVGIAIEELKRQPVTGEQLWNIQHNRAGTWQLHLSATLLDTSRKVVQDMTTLGKDPSLISLHQARDLLSIGRSTLAELANQPNVLKRYFVINPQGQVCIRVSTKEVDALRQAQAQKKELVHLNRGISKLELQNRPNFPYITFLRWVAHKHSEFVYSSTNRYPPKIVQEFQKKYDNSHHPPLPGEYYSEKQLRAQAKQDGYWQSYSFMTWAAQKRQHGEIWRIRPPFSGIGNKEVTRYHQKALRRYLETTFPDQQTRVELKDARDALEPIPDGWVTKKSLQETFNIYAKSLDPFITEFTGELLGVQADQKFQGRVHPAMCVTRTTIAVYLEFQLLTNFSPNARTSNPWAEFLPQEYQNRQVLIDQLKTMGIPMLPKYSRPD